MKPIQRRASRYILALATASLSLASLGWAADNSQSEVAQRLSDSTKVLNEVMSAPDKAIPAGVIQHSQCVAVFPSTIQVAVLVGAKHGKGFVTCRTSNGWSAPAPLDISGGSWGAQLGGESIDLIVLVTDEKGLRQLESGKFRMGVETSVTAGPVGGHHMTLNADVVSYSRSRGVFAGTNITGSSITEDESEARAMYGSALPLSDILNGKAQPPSGSDSFLKTVENYAGETKAKN
ncbi:MAG TPA: lipid-binding SYLF domain-containing protein [Candidatus Sulfotelmatobacter sp.]|nr:lipid-binding SYLF domain-containing protein [Candidatus Sulfotelmatobacter sp.]